ncbi:MAG: metallophosphoesterase [Fibrobacteres bacterium]|nr:metallophosphoesterase [Fibrobacterota bacterium]
MKTTFLIFFSVFFTVYASLNYYVIRRSFQLLPSASHLKIPLLLLMIFLALAFILGHVFSRSNLLTIAEPLEFAGSFWIGAAFYLFLTFLAIDFTKLVIKIVADDPIKTTESVRAISQIAVPVFIAAILIYGFINSRTIRTTKVKIDINKTVQQNKKSLKIVMLSDIHLGVMMDKCRFTKIVNKVNAISPDIILLAGDMLDQDVSQVIRKDLGASLLELKAPFGVYACTGNHEYIGGIEKAVEYLNSHNIKLLQDTLVNIGGILQVAGRKDRSGDRFGGDKRKELSEILMERDPSLPLILLDHQPTNLKEAEINSVDLQLSGHTHHGQMWPVNFITGRIFENDYGYSKKGNTHYYVSSGAGTWGPPIRVGSICEIVEIDLNLK